MTLRALAELKTGRKDSQLGLILLIFLKVKLCPLCISCLIVIGYIAFALQLWGGNSIGLL